MTGVGQHLTCLVFVQCLQGDGEDFRSWRRIEKQGPHEEEEEEGEEEEEDADEALQPGQDLTLRLLVYIR